MLMDLTLILLITGPSLVAYRTHRSLNEFSCKWWCLYERWDSVHRIPFVLLFSVWPGLWSGWIILFTRQTPDSTLFVCPYSARKAVVKRCARTMTAAMDKMDTSKAVHRWHVFSISLVTVVCFYLIPLHKPWKAGTLAWLCISVYWKGQIQG